MGFRHHDNRPGIHIHIGGGGNYYDDGGAHVPWSEKTFGQKALFIFFILFAIVVVVSMIVIGLKFFKTQETSKQYSTAQHSMQYVKNLLIMKGF